MQRRQFLTSAAGLGLTLLPANFLRAGEAGQTLYNGIRLPATWPPRVDKLTPEPMAVPYLQNPPAVIPIDVGRQLFVDDFLIAQTNLRRTFHHTTWHPATPVLRPDQKHEMTGDSPCAMVFSDGVWYDPRENLYKMWYMGGIVRSTCYATSRDGITWTKPRLDVVEGTNIVHNGFRDSTTVWLDLDEADAKRRYKLWRSIRHEKSWALSLHFSPDGIHWSEPGLISGLNGDRTTCFYNPFRRVWVSGLRSNHRGRTRDYWESSDVVRANSWKPGEPTLWVGADRLDPIRADLNTACQLYNLDCVAYESILLGLFSIWRGQPRDRAKPNEIVVGYSRDGFHWHRPDRRALIPVSERHGDWNWGNVQSAGGCCLIVGDELRFYVSGRAGIKGAPTSGVCSTGLAVLRRDGFASMDAGNEEGTLTTRPVRFSGRHAFVNVDCPEGELRMEILDQQGKPIAPFTKENCASIRADRTKQAVQWKGADGLGPVAGRVVKCKFYLTRGKLYAFWVSPETNGVSRGYVAAGGPAFRGHMDR
jgi:hypothetical protein